jgi:hypothetical protein
LNIGARNVTDGTLDPEGGSVAESILTSQKVRQAGELSDKVRGQALAKPFDPSRLFPRHPLSAEQLECEPARSVRLRPRMREQIPRDAAQPSSPKRIEPSLFQRIEQLGLLSPCGLVTLVNPGVVMAYA